MGPNASHRPDPDVATGAEMIPSPRWPQLEGDSFVLHRDSLTMLQMSFLSLAIGLGSGWSASIMEDTVEIVIVSLGAVMFGAIGFIGIVKRNRRIVALRVDAFGVGFGRRKDARIPWGRLGEVHIAEIHHQGMKIDTVLRFRIKGRVADGSGRGARSSLPGGLFAASQYDVNATGLDIPLERIAEAVERLRERYA